MEHQPVLDQKRLIGKVAERHGIRIDEDDPVFYLLSLNEFALEEATKTIVGKIQTASHDFESAFERVQQRMGKSLAQQLKESSTGPSGSGLTVARKPAIEWMAVGILVAVLIFASGVLVGMTMK